MHQRSSIAAVRSAEPRQPVRRNAVSKGQRRPDPSLFEYQAGGGLLHRRAFLTTVGAIVAGLPSGLRGEPVAPARPDWMKSPGDPPSPYGAPSAREAAVKRSLFYEPASIAPGLGASMTPLHLTEGTITPNGLHFERHHSGVPHIDPDQHRLLLHGLVERPLIFDVASLRRYPMVSRICFIECSGNSAMNTQPEPLELSCAALHGLLSCSEWTGIALGTLLDEAGVHPNGRWLLAEGGDAAAMSRSVPIERALSDGIVALYQNGEPLRPEQGYPMRLLLPGLEGNINVKWLRRIEVTEGPMHTRDETSKYTELLPDGRARQFTLTMGVKSIITRPSAGMTMQGPGFYEISGLAWSGAGRVAAVEVSADGGTSWGKAELQEPLLAQSLTRFRIPWHWDGSPTLLQSRAIDEMRERQPTRDAWLAANGPAAGYHYNGIQTWRVDANGAIKNVYG
ncbi:MAG: sulfite dehydrogenase [Deltaproteobacteria bacterium]|nr:sulfite dehydrogenase [Deltaproteobacteria bacterium]